MDHETTKIEDVQGKPELVNIQVTREEINEIVEQRHEKFSKVDLTRQGQFLMALAFIQSAKAFLAVTSKEKAKEAIAKAVYDFAYMEGRAAAEKRSNPKDLQSYLEYQQTQQQLVLIALSLSLRQGWLRKISYR